MRKQKTVLRWLLLLLLLGLCAALAGCGSTPEDDFADRVKVTFELEGGVYQNCTLPVNHYYSFRSGTENRISDLSAYSGKELARSGYVLEGWYRQKNTAADGTVTYSGKWDFETDLVGEEGVTLYAFWKPNITYTYEVCYRDGDGIRTLGTYEVNAGEAFDDYLNYAGKRPGYTSLGVFRDETGAILDSTAGHPGGETDLAVRVFPDYVEGDYAVVRTPTELVKYKSRNIYLMNDIDFEGKSFGGFGTYTGTIEGNGYSIKNFSLSYRNGKNDLISDPELSGDGGLLCIALFQNLRGATLRNVSFTDFTVKIECMAPNLKRVIVAPLALKCSGSALENVTVSATYTVGNFPAAFSFEESGTVLSDRACYYSPEGDSTVYTSVSASLQQATDA